METSEPWSSYCFFPANFYLFGAGMMAHRSMGWLAKMPAQRRLVISGIAIVGFALLFLRPLVPGFRNYSWAQEIVLAVSLPFMFETTRLLSWDRAVGNLSYSVYLLHEPVISWLGLKPSGIATVAITLPLATAVYVVVERPIDRWRQRRAREHSFGAKAASAA
jgi:peptidoglycan/LPS O-acetylase OafA/YrhL